MTYTIHAPSKRLEDKALASTEFSDMAEVLAVAMLRYLFRPDTELFVNDPRVYVEVRQDGKPYMRFGFEMAAPKVRRDMVVSDG